MNTQYEDLLAKIRYQGTDKEDRTGTGTKSIFGAQMRFDLSHGFPLITTKKVNFKAVAAELLWFLSGSTNTNDLDSTIWNEWQDSNGNLGPIYSHQWRNWGGSHENRKQPSPNLRSGVERTYLGVGNGSGKSNHPLGKTWEGMMSRCYDPNSNYYAFYGGKGVSVCDRWLEFEAFASDAEVLPGSERRREDTNTRYVLDKDILGDGYVYSPDSCQWVTDVENRNVSVNKKTYVVKNKEGKVFEFSNVSAFCLQHGLEPKNFSDLWTGNKNAKVRNGFTFVEMRDSTVGIDQISAVIESIKSDPDSRRHIVSAWNVSDIPYMALPPCHTMFQFYVANGKLSCQLYQRSGDMFLGIPFNIASYSLLTHMVAQQTGLEVGEFIHTIGDAHIYTNHLNQVDIQLGRRPYEFPTLKLEKAKDVFSYKYEDFEILNYHCHPAIKAPVAV